MLARLGFWWGWRRSHLTSGDHFPRPARGYAASLPPGTVGTSGMWSRLRGAGAQCGDAAGRMVCFAAQVPQVVGAQVKS